MPRIQPWALGLGLLLATPAAPLGAQSFSGTGQQATDLFALPAGLTVFEVEHRANAGSFAVRLLDGDGRLVEEIARGDGRFAGSKAVRIPEQGRYLLDVTASGAWVVRRRDAPPAAPASPAEVRAGEEAGEAAARQAATGGWLVRGLVGGALAGPVGAAIAVGSAGRSGPRDPALQAQAGADPGFREGFEEAYLAHVRQERRKRAFIGGMLGTGVFLTAVIATVDIASRGGGGTAPPLPPGGEIARTVPFF
jgi:hypothetical protein